MKSSVFCVTSSLLFALVMNSRAEAASLHAGDTVLVTGVDRATFIKTGEDTGGQYTLADFYVPPQGGAPVHIHHRESEGFYITKGELLFQMGNQTIDATPGTFLYGPMDHVHGFKNVGTQPADMLVTWTPSGIENFFAEVGEPVTDTFIPPPLTPEQLSASAQQLLAAGPKYGLEFLDPSDQNAINNAVQMSENSAMQMPENSAKQLSENDAKQLLENYAQQFPEKYAIAVPESSSPLGVLAFGALGAISILKRKRKSVSSIEVVETHQMGASLNQKNNKKSMRDPKPPVVELTDAETLVSSSSRSYRFRDYHQVMDTADLEQVAEVADVVQVGVRNMQNFSLLKKVGVQEKQIC